MQTTAVGAAGPGLAGRDPASPLGRDVFLKLLITQLRNQDPLKPMEDKEFIAQLAQFSSLEQMQAMNQSLAAVSSSQSDLAALSLVGRTVGWIDAGTGDVLSGTVEGVRLGGESPLLKIGGADVPLGRVVLVS